MNEPFTLCTKERVKMKEKGTGRKKKDYKGWVWQSEVLDLALQTGRNQH